MTRFITALALAFWAVTATQGVAQNAAALDLARAALAQFQSAQADLDKAETAGDRVKALSAVIRAYEENLEAMREAMRHAALRQGELDRNFEAESDRVATLLGVLISLRPDASPAALVHPTGALGHARSGMLVSALTPAMQAEVDQLRTQLDEAEGLRDFQKNAVETLELGLKQVQSARTELSQSMSNRTELPRRFVTDPDRVGSLAQSSETIESFAEGLAVMDVVDGVTPLPDFGASKGQWKLPVQGEILRHANEADAAGIKRPGWIIATRPLSLVSSPWPATVRYQGAFLDYGNVIILEPANDVLLVLAGLDEIYGEVGEVVNVRSALGLMGGAAPDLDDFVENATEGAGAGLSETLYIEVREGGHPVDPATWFMAD